MMEPDPVERMLVLARGELSPPAAEKARIRAALGRLPGSGPVLMPPEAPTGVAPELPSASPSASGRWRALLIGGAFLAAIGGSFAAGLWLGQRRPAPAPAPTHAVAVPAPPAQEPAEGDSPATATHEPLSIPPPTSSADRTAKPAPERRAATARQKGPPERPRAAAPLPLDELSLLRRVERALRNDEPAVALALLGELDEHFPNSALGEERSAAGALAHCQLHDPGAAQRAAGFLRDHAASVYADHVRTTCGLPAQPADEGSSSRGHE